MLQQIIDRLKDRRLYVVASETGVSYQTILNIVKGKTKNPSIDTVEKLQGYLDGRK
jgi:transcriptional regulator with XRE-family HTH domain